VLLQLGITLKQSINQSINQSVDQKQIQLNNLVQSKERFFQVIIPIN